ncbi:MAG: hypothetical protein M0R80_29540 [Proteobacteria bacterium]|jgi:SMC interacting uncharacterized protein involved in chromosome segregation|nr:hypothetical protein [Pseudomonadota bacterium]
MTTKETERLIKLEEKVDNIKESMNELKDSLNKFIDCADKKYASKEELANLKAIQGFMVVTFVGFLMWILQTYLSGR